MARARNIKPGFFRNADLVELSMEARLLFVGLWTLADREGRLEDRPKQIKMEIFPADNVDCDALISAIAETGMLVRYDVDGKRYLQVVNFSKHQNPHRDEKASTIPDQSGNCTAYEQPPKKHSANTVQPPCNEAADTVAIGLIPDSLIPEVNLSANASVHSLPAEDLLEDGNSIKTSPLTCPSAEIVALYHECMPDNPRCKILNDARKGAIRARWREAAALAHEPFGYTTRSEGMAAWKSFFQVCAESDFLTGKATPQPGRPPFLAEIDFIMSPQGFAKCLENKYHRTAA